MITLVSLGMMGMPRFPSCPNSGVLFTLVLILNHSNSSSCLSCLSSSSSSCSHLVSSDPCHTSSQLIPHSHFNSLTFSQLSPHCHLSDPKTDTGEKTRTFAESGDVKCTVRLLSHKSSFCCQGNPTFVRGVHTLFGGILC